MVIEDSTVILKMEEYLFLSIYSAYLETDEHLKAVAGCSLKRMFLRISQNSQKNTCARVFFNKGAVLRPAALLKKRLCHRCFPVNFAIF